MSFIKNNQKGSSLIETLGVLTIIMVLSVSAMKVISNAYEVLKQSLVIFEIKDVQKAISGVYNYSGNYNQLFKDNNQYKILCETDKTIPNQLCIKSDSDYKLKHKLGGNIILTPWDDFNNYSIKVDGLNKKNCMEITEIDWVNKKKVDIYKLEINGSEVAHYPQEGEKSFPIPTMKAISSCSKNGKENFIELFFY